MIASLDVVVIVAWLAITAYSIGHALLRKIHPASAWGWISAALLLPFVGPALYSLFGVNRVKTRARKRQMPKTRGGAVGEAHESDARRRRDENRPAVPEALREVVRTGDVITRLPLLDDNRLEILHNGEQAYPRMLEAIEKAEVSIACMFYIFDLDPVGVKFVDALTAAHRRGVDVRCVLDGIGELAWRRAGSLLVDNGLAVVRYNPLRFWPPFLHANLRNHRKLLIVDEQIAYTGGMNISLDHMADEPDNPHRTIDSQIEVRGPVIGQLMQVFCDDWRYASGEDWHPPTVRDEAAMPSPTNDESNVADSTICRVITDGPNEDYGHLSLILLAAISSAQRQVHIVTPYFLPPDELLTAMQSASLRGVAVDVILSSESDHKGTHYATQKLLSRLIERGVRVHYQAPPFRHTKAFVIDGHYAQFGSANFDPRSLGLNFEMNVEVYDDGFAGRLAEHCKALIANAHLVTLAELRKRSLVIRLRDAFCWLFSPYL